MANLKTVSFHKRKYKCTVNIYEFEGFQIWNKNGNFTELVYVSKHDSVQIKYVHQLQNLFFALKGKELIHKKL